MCLDLVGRLPNLLTAVFQIGALPIVVLAPLGGVSLLWNSVLAHILLSENFTSAMLLGTVLVATGAALIAIFGVVPDGNHSLDELLLLWARPPFVAFFVIICFAVLVVLAVAHVAVWRTQRIALPLMENTSPSNYASPQSEAAIPFLATRATPRTSISSVEAVRLVNGKTSFAVPEETSRTRMYCGLAFAAASGTLSGLCLVLAKAAVELVITTIEYWRTGKGANEFTRVQTWFLVAGLAVAAVLQLVYLNYSLAFASPALICPLAFCFYNLASIFDGLVFYNQLGRLKPHQVALVSIGVAILLVGVWTVSAVQPTGDGGVEVGTWVEEECAPWFDEEVVVDEPLDVDHDELEAADEATLLDSAESADAHHDHPVLARPAPINTAPQRTISTPTSPHSPVSPSHPRRKRLRFGTLIPDLAPSGAPTGFAFGIGAASPGFALRSNSVSLCQGAGPNVHGTPPPRRSRSRSEVTGPAGTGRLVPLSIPSATVSGPVSAPGEPTTGHVEEALAEWDQPRHQRWRVRFPSLLGGRVKLP